MPDDFRPTATIEALQQRARVLAKLRAFFDGNGFFEVQTPLLSRDIVVDRHLDPIAVTGVQPESRSDNWWLQTSPEFAMKRLVASGATAIYQIGPAFRAGEAGQLHNPEFTMLEWYRVGDDMRAGMELLGALVQSVLDVDDCRQTSYRSAFETYVGIDVLKASCSDLQSAAERLKLDVEAFRSCDDLDTWRNLLLTHVVEPNLGKDCPQIIYDWPASQSALAVVRDGDPPVAERFELYVRGVELANGYHELLDAEELLQRNIANNAMRKADGKQELPEESRLLAAMRSGMPACSGVALGVDRLVMLANGAADIRDVMPFPIENA